MHMTNQLRKLFRRLGRDMVEQKSYGSTADVNAEIRRMLDRCWDNGRVGVKASGMDCDCTQYYSEYTIEIPNSVQAFKRWEDRHLDGLDGPETLGFCPPGEIVRQHHSRDLALEAYENGHPSVVYPVGIDELVERN